MRDLHVFFKNPLNDPGISMDQLLTFGTNHLARLIANNTLAVITARITATTAALAQVESVFDDDATQSALRKARNEIKDNYRKALLVSVESVYGAIIAKVTSKSVIITECLPEGRTVFSRCKDDRVESNLNVLIDGVTAHTAELSAQLVTDATALLTGWLAVYNASETTAGVKSNTIIDKQTARNNLQLEIFRNILTLALAFPDQPEMCDVFMQQSYLYDHPHTTTPPTPPTPTPATPTPTPPTP